MSIVFSDRAEVDAAYLAGEIRDESGVAAADRFAARLRQTAGLLERLPHMGEAIDPPFPRHPGLRVFPIRKQPHHLVFYTPTDTGILIVRVLHASRNIPAIFGAPDDSVSSPGS